MAPSVGVVIDAPPLTPPANGLLRSAQVIDHTDATEDSRWENGVSFVPEGCGGVQIVGICDFDTDDLEDPDRGSIPLFTPFGVYAADECGTFGYKVGDYTGRARRILAARATTGVELEFWEGTRYDETNEPTPHLASGDAVTQWQGGDPLGLVDGLAGLVQGIADNGLGSGMIHARPSLVTKWTALNLLYREGGKLYTYTGQLVVPGTGYTGSAPDGTDATLTSEWAYATELVQVHRGPVVTAGEGDMAATLDRTTNTVRVWAQQVYSVIFNNCAIVGANINPSES